MAFLTAEQILAAEDLPFRDELVPEWPDAQGKPGMVRVLGLSAEDASTFGAKLVSLDGKGNIKQLKMDNFLAELLALTLVNEKNERLFTKEQAKALGKKSAAVMKRLGDISMELSGLSEDSKKAAEKKSEGIPEDDSHSD